MSATGQQGRSGRPWQRFRRLVLQTYGNWCWLCHKPIDLGLDPNHRMALTVDHVDPLSLGGAPMDLDRARPAHRSCNSSRGNRVDHQPTPLKNSRAW